MLNKIKNNYLLLIFIFLLLYFLFNLLSGQRGLISYFDKQETLKREELSKRITQSNKMPAN